MKKREWKRCDYIIITKKQKIYSGWLNVETSIKLKKTILEKIVEFVKENFEIEGKIKDINFTLSDIK